MFSKILILSMVVAAVYCKVHYAVKEENDIPQEYNQLIEHALKAYHEAANQQPAYQEVESPNFAQIQGVSQESTGFGNPMLYLAQRAEQYEGNQNAHYSAPAVQEASKESNGYGNPILYLAQRAEQYKKNQNNHYSGPALQEASQESNGYGQQMLHLAQRAEQYNKKNQNNQYFAPSFKVEDIPAAAEQATAGHEVQSNHLNDDMYRHQARLQQQLAHKDAAPHGSHEEPIDYYAYPKYQFEYKVEDPHTGDNKFQQESRDGDKVKGMYSLLESDGSIRTVEYTSDDHNGFQAVVKHTAPEQHVESKSQQRE